MEAEKGKWKISSLTSTSAEESLKKKEFLTLVSR